MSAARPAELSGACYRKVGQKGLLLVLGRCWHSAASSRHALADRQAHLMALPARCRHAAACCRQLSAKALSALQSPGIQVSPACALQASLAICMQPAGHLHACCAGVDWRQKLDAQRGAVLATELKNNANKLARWTAAAMISGTELIKLGYISRHHPRENRHHTILGTQVGAGRGLRRMQIFSQSTTPLVAD